MVNITPNQNEEEFWALLNRGMIGTLAGMY
jgi:hypothetical protein